MTAFREYERLEATGLWRATPEAQRREVLVSVGEATLTISDFQGRALTHWSLAAILRKNPGRMPATYHPEGDPGETLDLNESEAQMIEAIERLRAAVDRARPRPGRLRFVGTAAVALILTALAVFWLPGAMERHALKLVPVIKRQAIGDALLTRVERVSGRACRTSDNGPVLARLARRMEVRKLVVLPGGVRTSLHLPGGIILLNRALFEDFEDPSVVAGYIVAEKTRAALRDPLGDVLEQGGIAASFRLLTTGDLNQAILDGYAERVLVAPRTAPPLDRLLDGFEAALVPSTPYAYARDITGESTIGLIEADPLSGQSPAPVLKDRDWVLLQSVCGG